MIDNKLRFAGIAMLLALGPLHAAESAGRILALQGSAVAVRGSQEITLGRGATVENGDLLRIAENSSLQVRFSDESVVALRANTQFKIDDYKFTEKGEGDTSIFSLLRGGMRTITGLIGKRSPGAYQMRSSTATIGIRGTHFTAVNCASDCTNADGTKAEDGLYGGVTDGRIIVRNASVETEFVRDQYFMVASTNTQPRPLLAPPGFLRDKLDGLSKASKGVRSAETSSSVAAGRSSVTEIAPPAPGSVAVPSGLSAPFVAYSPASSPAASASTILSVRPVVTPVVDGCLYSFTETLAISEAAAGISSYSGSQNFVTMNAGGSFSETNTITNVPVSSMLEWYKGAFTGTYTSTDEFGNVSAGHTIKSASVDKGSFTGNSGATAYWGRFQETDNITSPEALTESSWRHWVVGNPVTAMPTAGTFTYSHVGGTSPTDQNGNVGVLTSGGAWTVNFASQTLQSASPVTWTMPGGVGYSVNIASPVNLVQSTYSYTSSGTINGVANTQSGTGTGFNSISGPYVSCTNCFAPTVSISPQFGGPMAGGLGMGIATSAVVAGATQATAQVRVYTKP